MSVACAACAAPRSPATARGSEPPLPSDAAMASSFSHEPLDRVLARFVDERGRVDYAGLAREPAELDRYERMTAAASPDSDPALFPTRDDELAYWINAYNAAAIATVVRHYPIASVTDVRSPFPLSLFSDKIGFFVLQPVKLGGRSTNLHELENAIRSRYREPRVHFALNCASRGCPRLPRRAFEGRHLESRLDEEAQRFFAEDRNLAIDHAARVVQLSAILDWYEDDFTTWIAARRPGQGVGLLDYVALYAAPERRGDVERARGYRIRFVDYDWRLNDQAAIE